jgi:hypothetical protein
MSWRFADRPTAAFHLDNDLSVALGCVEGASCMHFHLPKPLHGWRVFAGEVGIIVLG